MGTHEYSPDTRNDSIMIYINGELIQRTEAKVSVFDSGFLLGDGVWEGIRLHNGHLVFLEEHLNRLYDGAKAMAINIGNLQRNLLRLFTRQQKQTGWRVAYTSALLYPAD
jgi:branched-chain amino acid aminotransferase